MIFNDEFNFPSALSMEGFVVALEKAQRNSAEESSENANKCGPEGCEI